MYMESAEYTVFKEKTKFENLNSKQIASDEFTIEIGDFVYTVKILDKGPIATNKVRKE